MTKQVVTTKTFYNSGDNYWELCYDSIENNKTALLYDPDYKYADIDESESMQKSVSQFLDIDFRTNTYIKLNRKRKTITIRQEPETIKEILSLISEPYKTDELWTPTNTLVEDMSPYVLTNMSENVEYVGFDL